MSICNTTLSGLIDFFLCRQKQGESKLAIFKPHLHVLRGLKATLEKRASQVIIWESLMCEWFLCCHLRSFLALAVLEHQTMRKKGKRKAMSDTYYRLFILLNPQSYFLFPQFLQDFCNKYKAKCLFELHFMSWDRGVKYGTPQFCGPLVLLSADEELSQSQPGACGSFQSWSSALLLATKKVHVGVSLFFALMCLWQTSGCGSVSSFLSFNVNTYSCT